MTKIVLQAGGLDAPQIMIEILDPKGNKVGSFKVSVYEADKSYGAYIMAYLKDDHGRDMEVWEVERLHGH